MTHESPGGQTVPIQLKSLSKVHYGLKVLAHEWVVVAYDTAGLGIILIVVKLFQSKVSQFALILFNVKDIGVCVHVLEPIGIHLEQLLEPL